MFKVLTKLGANSLAITAKSTAANFVTKKPEICKRMINLIPSTNALHTRSVYNISCRYLSATTGKIDVPIVWVIGGPGSGKGTQCDRIVEKYGFTHLSSGDLLRNEVASGSPRGKELSAIMESGALVPLDIVLELIKEAMIKSLSNSKGFLIDGYPREKQQGIRFEEIVGPVNVILFFEAKQETLVARLINRGKTSGRIDDNEETIKKRLQTFITHTDEIANHYSGKIKKIDAERGIENIFTEVQTYLDVLVK